MFLEKSDAIALVLQDQEVTYRQLLQHIKYYSTLFPEDATEKVAIFAENRLEWVYAHYAAWYHNNICVPIDFLAGESDVAYILNDCKPEIIFITDKTKQILEQAAAKLNYEIRIINIDEQKYDFNDYTPADFGSLNPADICEIIYTSGTTGSPKGVMLTYDNLQSNIEAVAHHIPIFTKERSVLVLLPLHHIFPLVGSMVAPLSVGGKIVFSPSMKSEDIMGTMQKNPINIMIGVPRLYDAIRNGIVAKINQKFAARVLFALAKKLNNRNFSKKIFHAVHEKLGGAMEYMVCGGAKLNEEMGKDYRALGFEMLEGFGMTEAAPMITFTRPGRWKIGSAGEPVPGLEVKAIDGEIAARGRSIMKGYYNKPEETAEMIRDGWLFTGDLGYLDEEGFIHITGRSKELIVLSNGKNITPDELEFKLKESTELISEVAVFGHNDILYAAIFPNFRKIQELGILNLEETFRYEVIGQFNKTVANYKKIGKFILIPEELPKTRLGKIQRFKLSEFVDQKQSKKKAGMPEPDIEEYVVIKNFLMEQKKSSIFPDDHLEIDLGLDSLDKVNLQVFLESTFGVNISEDTLIEHPTVEKLSRFMQEKKAKLSVEAVKWSEILKEKVDLKLPKSWFTQNLFKHISKWVFSVYFRIKGEGTENLPQGPFIITPNHQSFFDGLFVAMFLKNKTFKNTYFYAKEKHVRNPLVRAIANRNNVIVMDINKDLKLSLQKLAAVLKEGKNIIIFPEGTRSVDGSLGEFKKLYAILSRELNVPVVPVSIQGAIKALPKGSIIPRPWKKINVKFHAPIQPTGMNYDELAEKVRMLLANDLSTTNR